MRLRPSAPPAGDRGPGNGGSSGSSGSASRKPAAQPQPQPLLPSPHAASRGTRTAARPEAAVQHQEQLTPPLAPACEHDPVSTYGLDGVLPWQQARHVAATRVARSRHGGARLDEAAGSVLARDLVTVQDDPRPTALPSPATVCGEARGCSTSFDVLTPGWASALEARMPVRGTPTPSSREGASVRQRLDGRHELTCHDLADRHPRRARPARLGEGIVRQGAVSTGPRPRTCRSVVTPACSRWQRPGARRCRCHARQSSGLVLGRISSTAACHGTVARRAGTRCPASRGRPRRRAATRPCGPRHRQLLLREIEDAAVDLLVTTGSTAPGPENHLRSVLRDLNAGGSSTASASPPAPRCSARLPDGRFPVGLPGDPSGTGRARHASPSSAPCDDPVVDHRSPRLMDDTTPADYVDDTAPCRCSSRCRGCHPGARLPANRPTGLEGWARAHAIAVVPPGAGCAAISSSCSIRTAATYGPDGRRPGSSPHAAPSLPARSGKRVRSR
jgi:hypothetical protein